MSKRIIPLAIGIAAVVFAGLLAYSQLRPRPRKVSGIIEAHEIRVGSRVGGRVAEVRIEEGQEVHADDVLLRLEPYDLDDRAAEAKSNLAQRQAELDRLQNGFRAEERAQAKARVDQLTANLKKLVDGPRPEEINAAQSRLNLAAAQLDRAQSSYDRTIGLFTQEKGVVTREQVDRATEELKVAEANRQVRQEELTLLQKGNRKEDIDEARAQLEEAQQAWQLQVNGYRSEEIAAAQAARDAAQAMLAAIESQRRELEIRAPVDGVVEAFELREGDLVPAGAPVLSLMDSSKLWVRTYVPEDQLDVKLEQEVIVTTDSYDQQFQGTITFISRQGEFTPSNIQTPDERAKQVFRIKVTLDDPQRLLRPGMAADVWLEN